MAAGDVSKALLAQVRARIAEPSSDTRSDDEIYGYLNEAQSDLVYRLCDAALLPLTEICNGVWSNGIYEYTTPADFLRERYVEVGGYPAPRMQLLEVDALRANVYHTASVTHPRYVFAEGKIRFYTGNADPGDGTYKVFYIRRPMWVRALTSAARSTNVVTLTFSANHGLTSANVGDTIVVEGVTPAGATTFNGTFAIASVPGNNTLTYAQTASNDTGTGGRCINTALEQISATEDPLIPTLFRGLMVDFAVARCREQGLNFQEAARQSAHYILRVDTANSRYGGGRPHDSISGDPGRLVQQPQ